MQDSDFVRHLSGGLDGLTALGDALQNRLTVLVDLELGDNDLGGVDGERDARAVGLLADDTLDVHTPLKTVDAGDLALTALVGAADNGDLVVLADGDGADLLKKNCQLLFIHVRTEPSIPRGHSYPSEDGNAYIVLLTELLGQRSAHDNTALTGGGIEVRLARLPARGGNCYSIETPLVLFVW